MCTRGFILKKSICKFALFRPALFRPALFRPALFRPDPIQIHETLRTINIERIELYYIQRDILQKIVAIDIACRS